MVCTVLPFRFCLLIVAECVYCAAVSSILVSDLIRALTWNMEHSHYTSSIYCVNERVCPSVCSGDQDKYSSEYGWENLYLATVIRIRRSDI